MTATEVDVTALLGRLAALEDRAALEDLVKRYALSASKDRSFAERRNPITPA